MAVLGTALLGLWFATDGGDPEQAPAPAAPVATIAARVETLPKVLLVDIEMPRMDGFELARELRGDARMQEIPMIFISSRTAEKHRTQAAQLGVNAFLGKPYADAELLQLVAKYVGTTS